MKDKKKFVVISEQIRRNVGAHLAECLKKYQQPQEGKKPVAYQVLIQPENKSESEIQRNGYWWLCGLLAADIGETKERIDELVTDQFYDRQEATILNKTFTVMVPPKDENGEPISRKELYSRRIEVLYQMSGEAGFPLPDLDPRCRS